MNIKSLISTVALVAGLSSVAPVANAGDYSASVDFVTQYNFRGVALGAESIQAGVEGAWGDFYAGAWASTGIGADSALGLDELDLYGGYGFTVSDGITADVGATLYHYPELGELFDLGIGAGDASTLELFGGLAFDSVVSPAIYVYYDTELEAVTLEGSGGYSFAAGEKGSIDLGASVGYVESDNITPDSWTYGNLSAAYSYALSDDSSAYIGLNGALSSEDTLADFDNISTGGSLPSAESSALWLSLGFSTDL